MNELVVLAYAQQEEPYSVMLPMVTDRCPCGRVVNLELSREARDWYPVRVNGNSENGYEPYCAAH